MKPLYAIRHKPSGLYLPEPLGRMGRGGSHLEPVDCSGELDNPRLFRSRIAARNTLSAWLRGTFHAERSYEDDGNGHGYWVDDLPSVTPQPHRKKEEMEIVEIHLSIK